MESGSQPIVLQNDSPISVQSVDGADFADSLIVEFGIDAGCDHTVTFDQKAAKKAGMQFRAITPPDGLTLQPHPKVGVPHRIRSSTPTVITPR
jgi:hypothetical protein